MYMYVLLVLSKALFLKLHGNKYIHELTNSEVHVHVHCNVPVCRPIFQLSSNKNDLFISLGSITCICTCNAILS